MKNGLSSLIGLSALLVAASCAQGAMLDSNGIVLDDAGSTIPSSTKADGGSSSVGADSGAGPTGSPAQPASGNGADDSGAAEDSGGSGDDSGSSPPPSDDSGVHPVVDSGGGGGGGVPTNCTQARGKAGCCVGNTAYYCSGTTFETTVCTGGKVCGWKSSDGYYYCVASPGGTDPSGDNPITCE